VQCSACYDDYVVYHHLMVSSSKTILKQVLG